MKRILVAGGAGFIGSNLCKQLIEDKKVICVDDFSSGRRKNVSDLEDKENFQIVKQNVVEGLEIEGPIDEIYHLASRASPPDYQQNPLHTMRTNSEGTYNLLKLADRKNSKFLFSSTSEVYGDPEVHPQTEEYNGNVNSIGPRACYDESKRYAETLVKNYSQENNLDAKIVRIFNTYGPGMKPDDGRVITNFLKQAIEDEPLTVYGDGSQTRSFCYISDMINALKTVMEKGKLGPYNAGNPNEITINELAQKIKSEFDTDSDIEYQELPEDDPSRRKPDISKIKKLGWRPETSLIEGLKQTHNYMISENHG